jgi:hypothetical protein
LFQTSVGGFSVPVSIKKVTHSVELNLEHFFANAQFGP